MERGQSVYGSGKELIAMREESDLESRRTFLKKIAAAYMALSVPACSLMMARREYGPLKTKQPRNALVMWYSQTGNTKRNGGLIAKAWERNGLETHASDIREIDASSLGHYDLIMIGSPVFYYDVPENVKDWLVRIPRIDGTPVASFVTFGGEGSNQHNTACTLLELLADKGGVPIGMEAFGSMTSFPPAWSWSPDTEENVLEYKYLPDKKTYDRVRKFASHMVARVREAKSIEIDPKLSFGDVKKNLAPAWFTKLLIGEHRIDQERCIGCGTCKKMCPVGAIDPFVDRVDTDRCIVCFGCLNNCPVEAVHMEFMRTKLSGYLEFIKRNQIVIKEPEKV